MSDDKKGYQTLDESKLLGASKKREDRTPEYKGGYAGPNDGGPVDEAGPTKE